MTNVHIRPWLAAALLASAATACGGDDAAKPDATVYNYDFSCMGNETPATAPATILVQGLAQEVVTVNGQATLSPMPWAADAPTGHDPPHIVACKEGGLCEGGTYPNPSPNNYGEVWAAMDGTWKFDPDPATNGVPLDVYMYVEAVGERKTYLWPNSPLYADNPNVKVPVMKNAFVAQLSALGIQQSPLSAIVGLMLVDCQDQPIVDADNVKVTLKKDGAEIPNLSFIDAHIFNEDFNGDFFLLNVPAGAIEVGATYKGMPLRGHAIRTEAGTTSETKLAPGFRPTS